MSLERYLVDKPIEHEDEDRLGVTELVQRIHEAGARWPPRDSFVIGVYGQWGSGKSSILNLLRRRLERDTQVIVVELDPWLHANQSALTLAFFQQLRTTIGEDFRIGSWLKKRKVAKTIDKLGSYVAAASSVAPLEYHIGGALAGGGLRKAAGALQASATSVARLRNEVASHLNRLWETHKTRVVYLVDDVDRLTASEILVLLKLVRHVVALPNISYVLAMDDVVVREQLQQLGHQDHFLQKFVQVEVRVPQVAPVGRAGLLREGLAEVADSAGYDVSPAKILLMPGAYGFLERLTEKHVTTLRERNRIASALRMLLTGSARETKLNLDDACLVAITSVLWPQMYRRIQNARDFLVDNAMYELAMDESKRKEWHDAMRTQITHGTEEPSDPLRTQTLSAMFPNVRLGGISARQGRDDRRQNRICSSDRFDWYFFSDEPSREASDLLVEGIMASLQEPVSDEDRWPHKALRDVVEGFGEKKLVSFQMKLGDRVPDIAEDTSQRVWGRLARLSGTLDDDFLISFANSLIEQVKDPAVRCALACDCVDVIQDPYDAADVADNFARSISANLLEECVRQVAERGLNRMTQMFRAGHPFVLTGDPYEVMQRLFNWEKLSELVGTPAKKAFREHLPGYVSKDVTLLPNLVASAVSHWGILPNVPVPGRAGGWEEVEGRVEERIGLDLFDSLASTFDALDDETKAKADPHDLVAGLRAHRREAADLSLVGNANSESPDGDTSSAKGLRSPLGPDSDRCRRNEAAGTATVTGTGEPLHKNGRGHG